jgi:hypothetical protein
VLKKTITTKAIANTDANTGANADANAVPTRNNAGTNRPQQSGKKKEKLAIRHF